MPTPRWSGVCTMNVPGNEQVSWVPALDYLTAGRLYRIHVPQEENKEQRWTPEGSSGCTADGDPDLTRVGVELPMPNVAVGALIGRIGGSTADMAADKDRMLIFAIGRYCVFQAPQAPTIGALFLGSNESRSSIVRFDGSLNVTIEQAF